MFSFTQIGPERGDCTAPYAVALDKAYTVKEFIQTVITERTDEWGFISIDDGKTIFGEARCEYRWGKLVSNLPKVFQSKTIISVKADGGWSRMDYLLDISKDESKGDLIDRKKLVHEAETCRETTDDFISLIKNQSTAKVHINLNEIVKFRLTDLGKDIFYHQYDSVNETIVNYGGKPIKPEMPKVDSDGFTEMQLWEFMKVFGPHTGMAMKNYIEPLEIIYEGDKKT